MLAWLSDLLRAAPQTASRVERDHEALDAVERRGHRDLVGLAEPELETVGLLPDRPVGIVGEVAQLDEGLPLLRAGACDGAGAWSAGRQTADAAEVTASCSRPQALPPERARSAASSSSSGAICLECQNSSSRIWKAKVPRPGALTAAVVGSRHARGTARSASTSARRSARALRKRTSAFCRGRPSSSTALSWARASGSLVAVEKTRVGVGAEGLVERARLVLEGQGLGKPGFDARRRQARRAWRAAAAARWASSSLASAAIRSFARRRPATRARSRWARGPSEGPRGPSGTSSDPAIVGVVPGADLGSLEEEPDLALRAGA